MKVLYLFGNGFDIANGFKTSTSDFYEYLDTKPSLKSNYDNNAIQKVHASIKGNSKIWSDYELGLGKHSSEYDDVESYISALDYLHDRFFEFISDVDSNISIPRIDNNLSSRVANILLGCLLDGLQKSHLDEIGDINSDITQINLVSFNYTCSIDKAFGSLFDNTFEIAPGKPLHIRNPLYIHSCLSENEGLIIGIDSEDQIANLAFRNNSELDASLVKPFISNILESKRIETFNNMLFDSDIVCVCGMSIGCTDSTYWKMIGQWLAESNDRQLIISCYLPDPDSYNPKLILNKKDDVKSRFLCLSNLGSNVSNEIKDRIYISKNPCLKIW